MDAVKVPMASLELPYWHCILKITFLIRVTLRARFPLVRPLRIDFARKMVTTEWSDPISLKPSNIGFVIVNYQ